MKCRNKSRIWLSGMAFFMAVIALFYLFKNQMTAKKAYGVFIGMDREKVLNLRGYHRLIVDADFLSEEDINVLKSHNEEVWSYLNIGSAEAFRKIGADLQNIRLGKYEHWEEEWIDITDEGWKKYLLDKANELKKKRIDGFFIDNTDIYDKDTRVEVYQSILEILTRIAKQKKPIIINGGDCFIKEAMEKNDLQNIVFGVNQETVFTKIDFKNGKFLKNEEQDRFYYQNYLEKCKDFGLHVFLIEYGPDKETEKQIRKYCLKKGFTLYVASSIELDREE